MNLTENQKKILGAAGNLLIEGGPGSGKTTIAIINADQIITSKLKNGQKVLFLSFSRAAVSRVFEAIENSGLFSREKYKHIEIETYHSFFWSIIRTHGYLLGLPRRLNILAPPATAVALSILRSQYKDDLSDSDKKKNESDELMRLAKSDGTISFDLFAKLVEMLLSKSEKIRSMVSCAFPYIFLDEFQDTNYGQWKIIKLLGDESTLIALADPEQRIFDFIGAHPERLNHFRRHFKPTEFDLGSNSHRSSGTDIHHFGNDILTGNFKPSYKGINIVKFPSNPNQAFATLKYSTLEARKRLLKSNKKDWSLAVLVPTKKLMRKVSDSFREGKATDIHHHAIIDMEGTVLSAEVIAFLLQPQKGFENRAELINLICNYYLGKGGSNPSNSDLVKAQGLNNALQKIVPIEGKEVKVPRILQETFKTYDEICSLVFSGNPDQDWLKIRSALEKSGCSRMKKIAEEAKNIRLLERGMVLRDALTLNWREDSCYSNALEIVRQAFIQEHFSTASKPENGVVIMNMHKAKGKQFDEVIIFEGWRHKYGNYDRIVFGNSANGNLSSARQNLRVSVTRAKTQATILTSKEDPCILLPMQ